MDSPAVLDASAILAVLFSEPGSEAVVPLLPGALVSAVNLAEVYGQLLFRGVDPGLAWQWVQQLGCEICPFDGEQARIAGEILSQTRTQALSLGDRACLALAIQRKATVYTSDAAWQEFRLGIEVEVIR